MFELSVARKYLTPRRRQLSVSIISLISILVISLVVWLVVVFFSVTHGLEKSWIQKLIALTAPIRITPTEEYYRSYYYQIDALSDASGYASKSIGEKLKAPEADPYDPESDGELSKHFAAPDRNLDGSLKDLAKEAYQIAQNQAVGFTVKDFEMTVGHLRLQLVRGRGSNERETAVSHTVYLSAFDPSNIALSQSIMPVTEKDQRNFLSTLLAEGYSIKDIAMGGSYLLQTLLMGSNGNQQSLPVDPKLGEGILLPKSFINSGVLVGDRGSLSYFSPTISSIQEQHLPIYVAGFFDPGIIPIGGKFALVNPEVVGLIRSGHMADETHMSNGLHVRFDDLDKANDVKLQLQEAFERAGISQYWRIETYREFEFTKDLIQQLSSERHLWTLLATVIIIVACSNIISMLIILVNDKKVEIGILRAMGAKATSIAAIFGICGMVMGMIGSAIGMIGAYFTLQHLQTLVGLIGRIQGYEMFNPIFYGTILPNQISPEAVVFVILTTSFISLLAGLIPAIKASWLRPSIILRAE